jgi:hypothetical protein
MGSQVSNEKKISHVKSIYLPEYSEFVKIAVEETRRNKTPTTVNSVIRGALKAFIEKYWKKPGH